MIEVSRLKLWWGLLRPKTLFSGLSAVLVAIFYASVSGSLDWGLVLLLIGVAVSAQVASNIANDLIDYRRGADTDERKGPTRPLSKGLISEREVKVGLGISLCITLGLGLALVALSSWWLIAVALAVIAGIFAYSSGPFALAYRGLGDVAVLIFFGIVPVVVSYYILRGTVTDTVLWHLALSIGLANVNILVVNNYRDYAEDTKVGKHTLIVKMGRDFGPRLYLSCGLLSIGLLYPIYSAWGMPLLLIYIILFSRTYRALLLRQGEDLNQTLAHTARNVFLLALIIGLMLFLKPTL